MSIDCLNKIQFGNFSMVNFFKKCNMFVVCRLIYLNKLHCNDANISINLNKQYLFFLYNVLSEWRAEIVIAKHPVAM